MTAPTPAVPAPARSSAQEPVRWWVWWWRCPVCDLASLPVSTSAEAAYLADAHDTSHHGSAPTARLRCVPEPPTPAVPAAGSENPR